MKERNDEQNIESNGGADRKLLIKIKSTYRDVGAFSCVNDDVLQKYSSLQERVVFILSCEFELLKAL